MKYTLCIFLVTLAGCGNPTEPEDTVSGQWYGTLFESSDITLLLDIYILENSGIGGVEYKGESGSSFHSASAHIIGTTRSFALHLQVGQDFNDPWVYRGYIKNGDLCLVRDALPQPVRCLSNILAKY